MIHRHYHRLLLSPQSHSSHIDESLSILFTLILFVAISYLIIITLRNFFRGRNQNQNPTPDLHKDSDCSAQLESIPVLKYGSCSSRFSHDPCSICLAEYEEGEEIRVLPKCNHLFHKECIDRWLITRSSFCPICRDRVVERAVEPATTNCRNNGNNNNNGGGGSVRVDIGMIANSLQLRAVM